MFDATYNFKGKHATYVKFLSKTAERLHKGMRTTAVFNHYVDVYLVAPLIGVAYNRKAEEDNLINDKATIFADAIIQRQENLITAYRLVMLYDDSTNLTDDEKIDRAFKQDSDSDKLSDNMELFHSYMRGGVEWLYEQFSGDANTKEDYLRNIKEVVENYYNDFKLSLPLDSLPTF